MGKTYNQRAGENFQRILSGIKRRRGDAARELGYSEDAINLMVRGEMEIPYSLAVRASIIWPVNIREFYPIVDDTPLGIKIMRAEDSERSARIMERAGSPYYEYRDMGTMTRLTSFRPEWIKELCVVSDNDPENPLVQWNNGHFEQQFTYFIGEVNFYFIDEKGRKQVAVMNTGDSMHISSFVPHTFTSRNPDNLGVILALTYGDKLWGDAQLELSALGAESASSYGFDFSDRAKAFASLLESYMEARSMGVRELSRLSEVSANKIRLILDGNSPASYLTEGQTVIFSALASALNISMRDLMPNTSIESRVIINRYETSKPRIYPENDNPQIRAYKIVDLASPKSLPYSSGLELSVLKNEDAGDYDLQVPRHQYVYNVGEGVVNINWHGDGDDHSEAMHSGDSAYIKPNIPHNFRGHGGKLVVLRIGGRIAGEPEREFSLIAPENRYRVLAEPNPWYNKEGKR